eukprot:CAMPEP_0202963942 /NCGR_PEP_ID=MMETSP1396-20130829/8006_1 /ASSEMBLY_ACC=CAM_ASM_000872 /TAXON_ID= /ORGANISM="Pseudokeronopsis sp., Strain Brazil" /LENGTH=71 /DNA_ID=CAMNT_0049685629 /DNA_START=330 /DNA_END=545 /DNA_ORIENTATION=-
MNFRQKDNIHLTDDLNFDATLEIFTRGKDIGQEEWVTQQFATHKTISVHCEFHRKACGTIYVTTYPFLKYD